MIMNSIFSKIIKGEIPCYKVAENEKFYAFLDINPLTIGHTLVVPKQEIDYLFDIDDALLQEYITFVKRVALAIENNVSCKRIAMSVIGLDVPHAHIHLIPLQTMDDVNFAKERVKLTCEEFQKIALQIEETFNLFY